MNTVIDFIMYKLYPLWMFGFNCSVTHVNQLPMYLRQFKLPIGYVLANRNATIFNGDDFSICRTIIFIIDARDIYLTANIR